MKDSVKKVHSVRLEEKDIERLKNCAESLGLAPAEIIRLATLAFVKETEKNGGKITLPFKPSFKSVKK